MSEAVQDNTKVVNDPSHYTDGQIEVIDFITDKNLDFCLGNTVKYIARAGKKDPDKYVEDLFKAAWYLNFKLYMIAMKENVDKAKTVFNQFNAEIDTLKKHIAKLGRKL